MKAMELRLTQLSRRKENKMSEGIKILQRQLIEKIRENKHSFIRDIDLDSHVIYAFCDPDTGEVKYISETKRFIEKVWRNTQVCIGKNARNIRKCAWIYDMKLQGKLPAVKILEQVTDENVAVRLDYWIDKYEKNGLFNIRKWDERIESIRSFLGRKPLGKD